MLLWNFQDSYLYTWKQTVLNESPEEVLTVLKSWRSLILQKVNMWEADCTIPASSRPECEEVNVLKADLLALYPLKKSSSSGSSTKRWMYRKQTVLTLYPLKKACILQAPVLRGECVESRTVLTLYPLKKPCILQAPVLTELQMKSAVVSVTSLSGLSRKFCGISKGTERVKRYQIRLRINKKKL